MHAHEARGPVCACRAASRPAALTLAARSARLLIPLLGRHLPCLTSSTSPTSSPTSSPPPSDQVIRNLQKFPVLSCTLSSFLYLRGIEGNDGNPADALPGELNNGGEAEGGRDSSRGSSRFAGVRPAQLFEMAPLACRLWGRALYEDA